MYNYRGKIKAIVIIVAVLMLMAVAVSFCLWNDTSIKSLKANGGTSNYKGVRWPSTIAVGDVLTIDDIKYTVGFKGTVDTASFVTLYSNSVFSKGVTAIYNNSGTHNNYDGRNSGGVASDIFTSITTYYSTLANKAITLDKTGVTYGNVSNYIIPHLDYGWSLWLPSVRELNLYNTGGYNDTHYDVNLIEGLRQPAMYYYDSDARRANGVNAYYWLRSPHSGYSATIAFSVNSTGSLSINYVNGAMGAVRVALNLRI